MQHRDWRVRIDDMVEAVERASSHVAGTTLAQFMANKTIVDAVMYSVIVLGEAARFVPPEIEQRHPEVPWAKMRGMRNMVVHHHFGINLPVLWSTVTQDMPPLVPMLKAILDEEAEPL